MRTLVRRTVKQVSFRTFCLLDRVGLHLLPKTFYSPVPDMTWLSNNKSIWMRRSSLPGLSWDLDRQLAWLDAMCKPYYHEVRGLEFYRQVFSTGVGAGYGEIESQVLHCFVRAHRPPRIIEIGSGASTMCILHADELNQTDGALPTDITSIEPFPKLAFQAVKNIRRIDRLCQEVPLGLFDDLRAGDLLFIDSSHAVKVGSDVLTIYLEIIPRLAPGVFIHAHDIHLPYTYPRNALTEYFGAQETSLLLALLMNNHKLQVQCCLAALHYDRPAALGELLADYRPQTNIEGLRAIAGDSRRHFPSSIWLQTQ